MNQKRWKKKIWKRHCAVMLVLVMVMTLFTGVSARAEEPANGLVIGWANWDDDGIRPFNEAVGFDAEFGVSIKNDNVVALAMKVGGERTPLSSDANLAIYGADNQPIMDGSASITPYEDESGLVEGFFIVRFEALGDYTIRYEGYSVAVNAGFPRVGIYSAETVSPENLIGTGIDYLDEAYSASRDYYILAYDEKDDVNNITLKRTITSCKIYDGEGNDITSDFADVTTVGTEGKGYKVTIQEEVRDYFVFKVDFQEEEPSDPPSVSDAEEYIEFRGSNDGDGPEGEVVEDGLVIGSPYGEDGITFEGGDFHNSFDISIKDDNLIILGMKEGEDIAPISHDDLNKLSITDEDDNEVSGVSIGIGYYWNDETGEDETDEGFFSINIDSIGTYKLTYNDTTSVLIHAGMPSVAAYSSETVSEDTLIGRSVIYNSTERTYYINIYDESGDGWGTTHTITGYRLKQDELPEDYINDMVTVEPTDHGYKVTIAESRYIWFSIIIELTNTHYWDEDGERQEDSWDSDEDINFAPDQTEDTGGGLWLDGAPQAGFSGRYISEDNYKYGVYNDAIDGNQYWVHAATVQEVIDKLSEVAIGDTVPGYVIDFESGVIKLDKNTNVTNTGYITVVPSQYGDRELAPQYVASSGNLHGISFGNSTYAYYVKEDADGVYTELTGMSGAAGDYIELGVDDPIRFLEFEGRNLTPEQTAVFEDLVDTGDGLIEYKGVFYRAERHENHYTNRDGIEVDDSYFTFASTEPLLEFANDAAYNNFMVIYNDFLDKYAEYLDETGDAANEYRRGDIMPGIHVNLYCDMQFSGDMGNLIIGYPDKSLTGGKQYEATIDGADVEITGPDSYPDDTLITSYGGPFGRSQYNLRTYAINSKLDVSGTATGVTAVVPEPNALSEMSYAQKDAIENGAKLTVDVTANEIDTDGTLDEDTKAAVDSLLDATGKSADNMEFLDFTVDASVEGVAGKTSITETVVPIKITIKPKTAIDKKSKYRIARYHKGKVDYLDLVESLYGEVAGLNIGYVINADGTITFLGDRFSVYALVDVDAQNSANETPAANVTPAPSTPAAVTPASTTATPASTTTVSNDNVKTGDAGNPFRVFMIMMASAGCMLAVNALRLRKRRRI